MFWIFDKLVAAKILTGPTATAKLKVLMESNIIYKGNQEMVKEAGKRFRVWGKTVINDLSID
jgi:hypothetical protein